MKQYLSLKHPIVILAICLLSLVIGAIATLSFQSVQAKASASTPNVVGTWKATTRFVSDPARPPENLTLIFKADGSLQASVEHISTPGIGRWFKMKDNTIIYHFLEPVIFDKQQLYVQVVHYIVFKGNNAFTSYGEGTGDSILPNAVKVIAVNQTETTAQRL